MEQAAKLPRIEARQQEQKKALVEHLRKMPLAQYACEKAGVSRATYYRWLKEDLVFAQEADEATREGNNLVSDVAESRLISLLRDGNLGAIALWLKHRHPAYRSKLEVQANVRHEDVPLTEEQAELVAKALRLAVGDDGMREELKK
jgi:hypothetical protein